MLCDARRKQIATGDAGQDIRVEDGVAHDHCRRSGEDPLDDKGRGHRGQRPAAGPGALPFECPRQASGDQHSRGEQQREIRRVGRSDQSARPQQRRLDEGDDRGKGNRREAREPRRSRGQHGRHRWADEQREKGDPRSA
jgi:hypothetical protein